MSDMTADEIISAIERDELTDEIENYIESVDNFLLKQSKEKTDFIEAFFNKSRERLISTVNSCIKSRNNKKKKDDLKKYKEGYFNEIVQNANDIVWKCEEVNPDITIRFYKEKEYNKYIVKCSYPDKGFTLKDVYGFCTRGNSNKSSENGQEGMYGIGIKSLFCFCDYFCIENNIKIELESTNNKLLNEILIEPVYNERSEEDCTETTLTFKFTYNRDIEESNKHAGFNVKKLADLIDDFISDQDICKYFYSEKEEETVFDIRSLMFTETGKNRITEHSIKSIILKGNNRTEEFTVNEAVYNNNIKVSIINHKSTPEENMKYFIFNYEDKSEPEKSISIGYPLCDEICNKNDRIYATFFVANSQKPLLEEKTGCLINTKAINSSRSGFERENEKEPEILSTIKNKGKQTITDIISILNDDNASYDFKKDASNLLCKLLFIYRYVYKDENKEIIPKGIFEGKLPELNNIFTNERLRLLDNKKYILKYSDEDKIDSSNKSLNKNMPINSNNEECRKLFNVFNNIFVRNDVVYYDKNNESEYEKLQEGIKNLCEYMFEDKEKCWLSNIKFPFIKTAKELIELRTGGNDFDKIMEFILSNNDNDKLSIKKIVARYEVNDCFDFMGRYSNNNIKNWLFCEKCQDYEFNQACKEYEQSYKELKNWLVLNEKIREAEYYRSTNWNSYSDYWYKCKNGWWDDKANNCEITEKEIGQFLSLLSRKVIKIGYNCDCRDNLFSHNLDCENLKLRNRARQTTYWDGSFKYFTLDFLNKPIKNFNNFKLFRQIVDDYNESKGTNDEYKIKKCILKDVDLEILFEIFKWISVYSYDKGINISVESLKTINSQDSDIIKFVQIFIKNVPIRLEKICVKNSGAKFIGYISNLNSDNYIIRYRKSASDVFKEISDNNIKTSDEAKSLVIFYTDDEQEALEKVLFDMNEYWKELPNYIKNFINTGNIRQLSFKDYNSYLKREDIEYTYKFEKEKVNSIIYNCNNLSIEDIYEVLSGEYSYDEHCPICNGIPTLNIKGDEKVSANKNCLVVIIPAKYNEDIIYVKIICCKSCFEEYRISLTSAEILEQDEYKILLLKSTIKSSCRSYDFEKGIKLSPDNWKIIEEFNGKKKVNL